MISLDKRNIQAQSKVVPELTFNDFNGIIRLATDILYYGSLASIAVFFFILFVAFRVSNKLNSKVLSKFIFVTNFYRLE